MIIKIGECCCSSLVARQPASFPCSAAAARHHHHHAWPSDALEVVVGIVLADRIAEFHPESETFRMMFVEAEGSRRRGLDRDPLRMYVVDGRI